MLKTDVDKVFHALVLNTAFYREVCSRFVGEFVDHTPMDPDTRDHLQQGAWHTVGMLEDAYGKNLHPALQHWRTLLESDSFVVSCVQCPQDNPMTETVVGHLTNGARFVH